MKNWPSSVFSFSMMEEMLPTEPGSSHKEDYRRGSWGTRRDREVSWHFEGHPRDEDDAVCESGPESTVGRLINRGQSATNYSFIPSPITIIKIKIKGERGNGNEPEPLQAQNSCSQRPRDEKHLPQKRLLRRLWRSVQEVIPLLLMCFCKRSLGVVTRTDPMGRMWKRE
jgi:hypothetical protein